MIGDRIKAERKARGWLIRDLAERSGISAGYLRLLETNKRPNPTSETLAALAAAFAVPIDTLLQDTGPDIRTPPIELLKAAGRWSERRERMLRQLWPGWSATRRQTEIRRLERIVEMRQRLRELETALDEDIDGDEGPITNRLSAPGAA